MAYMKKLFRVRAVMAAAGAIAGYIVTGDERNKTVLAALTPNNTSSVKWDSNWDRRAAQSLAKPSKSKIDCNNNRVKDIPEETLEKDGPTSTRHLIFVRHGQFHLQAATDADKYLTKLGREQAALTGERLKQLKLPYSRIVYSTMTRATETAKIISGKLSCVKDVEHCDLLREGAPLLPEPPINGWQPEMHEFYVDGARIEAAFRKYFHRASSSQEKDSYEVFVCHGNVIRYFVCRALQLPLEAWSRMTVNNGSMTYLIIRPDGQVVLKQLGECGYMPPDKVSEV